MPEKLLQIFAKAPVPGFVKTRLITDLGVQGACDAYVDLLEKTFELAARCGYNTELWCAPERQDDFFLECSVRLGFVLHEQSGDDLGDRMRNALAQGLRTHRKVVLIGSDCPVFTEGYLSAAFDSLDLADMVLGPAEDGGFVLLGGKKVHEKMFYGVNWGNNSVLDRTTLSFDRLGLTYELLATLWDVDVLADYKRWKTIAT
tara:strand:- start:1372 stop:1977 length:606 start_codon:yes stop_codon:yes gene_type:complete